MAIGHWVVCVFLLTLAAGVRADAINGQAAAIDGDTIAIGAVTIEILDIDVSEAVQTCWRDDGSSWPCG